MKAIEIINNSRGGIQCKIWERANGGKIQVPDVLNNENCTVHSNIEAWICPSLARSLLRLMFPVPMSPQVSFIISMVQRPWHKIRTSKYPGVINLPAELVPSHGASRWLGNNFSLRADVRQFLKFWQNLKFLNNCRASIWSLPKILHHFSLLFSFFFWRPTVKITSPKQRQFLYTNASHLSKNENLKQAITLRFY